MRQIISLLLQLIFLMSAFLPVWPVKASSHWIKLKGGDLIKLPDDSNPATLVDSAVYYYGADGLRYVFPNSKTYFTWYSDFKQVREVGAEQLGTIGIGGNVTYRPGWRMIKIESDPKAYAVDRQGTRRWVTSEAAAIALYGSDWNKKIDDVPDAFFSNYPEGASIENTSDFNSAQALANNPSIEIDRDLAAPVEVTMGVNGFSPATVSVKAGRTIRFTNQTGATARLASNPHPAHTDLAGFDSAFIPAGLDYVFKFKKIGAFGFHNHANPSQQGLVTINP